MLEGGGIKMKRKNKRKKTFKKPISLLRFYTVAVFFLVLGGAIFFRLFWLQIKQHNYYTALADSQYQTVKELKPQRGEIFLRGREENFAVAVNKEIPTVYVVPGEIENKEEAVTKLADTLDLEKEMIRQKVYKKDDPYEVIKRKISEEEFKKIRELNIKGVHFEKERWRYYPGGELAAQTIGFLGYGQRGLTGRYGVEQYFDDVLRGQKGLLKEDRDVAGRWISIGQRKVSPSRDGSDLVLSLNQVIQFKAELALKNAVEKHQADGGKIIITEVGTGKILAMASWPTFNPNEYSRYEAGEFKNPIISGNYEPGSVFKIITMAAGLDTGRVSPNTTYNDTGSVVADGFEIRNSDEKAYGQQTMTEVIEKSLNTGVIFVEKLLGHKLFAKYVKKFGFGQKTGITLPGETAGNISNLKTKRDIEFFTASFGQGISVTPLQLAMAYGAIANKGILLKPIVVDKIIHPDGKEEVTEIEEVGRVISQTSARQASLMLESNVQNGHGKLAGVPGYKVAGKTGTAQIPDKINGGYLEGATIGTFAGFAPVDNPIFAMVVIIDHPRDVEWAAATAAPVFGEMTKFLLDYYGVKPTEDYSPEDLEMFDKKHNYLDVKLSEKKKEDN